MIGTQALQRSFDGAPAVLRRPIQARELTRLDIPSRAELGGDEYLIAAICERFTKERFIGTANPIQFCRIEVFDAQVYCFVQKIDGSSVLHRWTVKL